MPTHNSARSIAVWGNKLSRISLTVSVRQIHVNSVLNYRNTLVWISSSILLVKFNSTDTWVFVSDSNEDFHALYSQ